MLLLLCLAIFPISIATIFPSSQSSGFGVLNEQNNDANKARRALELRPVPRSRPDPASTLEDREERRKTHRGPSKDFIKPEAHSSMTGDKKTMKSFGTSTLSGNWQDTLTPAATLEEREAEHTRVTTRERRTPPRPHQRRNVAKVTEEHNKRLARFRSRAGFNPSGPGMGAGSSSIGGAPAAAEYNFDQDDDDDDDLDPIPSANDLASAMGVGGAYGGPPGPPSGGDHGGDGANGDNQPPISAQRGPEPQAQGNLPRQHHLQQQQFLSQQRQTDSLMGGVDTTAAGSLPNKQQLYGNSDLSQIDKDYIFEGLRRLYNTKVLPLEMASKYSNFASPPMSYSDFEAKPMVLIIGQYSVGKTSFIRSLVKQDFPGQRIGPEPTTDRFTAIMHSDSKSHLDPHGGRRPSPGQAEPGRLIPGHALVMESDKPFSGLGSMGNNFLSKFEGAEIDAAILRNITIIDTPGVLAGEKQRLGRDYDFSEVIKWFSERADMIIVMFDGHKLDISDELKTVLDVLKPHNDKLRVLLNKADSIDTQSLLRVYGALMWSLGKVVGTPEACRIYLGSFWDGPMKLLDNRGLLEREKSDLLTEMACLPANAVIRRINELVKRARSVKVHAYIIHYLKKQMPYLVGKTEKQAKLLERLDKEFIACARRYNLPLGDFPNVDQYRKMLAEVKDISDFKKLDKRLVVEMDRVLTHDIPLLLQKAQQRKRPIGSGTNAAMRAQHQQRQHQMQQQHYQRQYQQEPRSQPRPGGAPQTQTPHNGGAGYPSP